MDETTNRIMLIMQDNGKPFPAGLLVITTFKIKNRYDYNSPLKIQHIG